MLPRCFWLCLGVLLVFACVSQASALSDEEEGWYGPGEIDSGCPPSDPGNGCACNGYDPAYPYCLPCDDGCGDPGPTGPIYGCPEDQPGYPDCNCTDSPDIDCPRCAPDDERCCDDPNGCTTPIPTVTVPPTVSPDPTATPSPSVPDPTAPPGPTYPPTPSVPPVVTVPPPPNPNPPVPPQPGFPNSPQPPASQLPWQIPPPPQQAGQPGVPSLPPADSGGPPAVAVVTHDSDGAPACTIAEKDAERLTVSIGEAFGPDAALGLGSDLRGSFVTSYLAGSTVDIEAESAVNLSGKEVYYLVLGTNCGYRRLRLKGEPLSCAAGGAGFICGMHVVGWDSEEGPLVTVEATDSDIFAAAAALYWGGQGAIAIGDAGASGFDMVKIVGGAPYVSYGPTGAERISVDFRFTDQALDFVSPQGTAFKPSLQDYLKLIYRYRKGRAMLAPFSDYPNSVQERLALVPLKEDDLGWVPLASQPDFPSNLAILAGIAPEEGTAVFPVVFTPRLFQSGFLGLVYDSGRSILMVPGADPEVYLHEFGHSFGGLADEYVYRMSDGVALAGRFNPNCARNDVVGQTFPAGLGGFGPPFYVGCRDMEHSRSSPTGLMNNPYVNPAHNQLGKMMCDGMLRYFEAEKES